MGSSSQLSEEPFVFTPPRYRWEEFPPPTATDQVAVSVGNESAIRAETFTRGLPTYVSVTTISGRLDKACDFVTMLFSGSIRPTHVYLFVSRDPYLMDEGITEATLRASPRVYRLYQSIPNLASLFTIVFTDNLGPHRKLLPLLAHKWSEDCVIVTFDDESGRRHPALEGPDKLLGQLLRYYRRSGECFW